jgi:hypothetical protein
MLDGLQNNVSKYKIEKKEKEKRDFKTMQVIMAISNK